MATRMQQRRGTAAQWSSSNPILNTGEIGFETDTNKFKIGDGTNHWGDLPYFVDQDSISTSLGDYVETSVLAQPDGVATLDSNGQIPVSQLGNIIDGAPGVLDTINEIAAAINDDPTFFTTVATNLSNHENDTTSVHGIADTSELATKTFAAELLINATKTNIVITGDKNGLVITAENGVADSTTDNLVEGTTNLYFSNERAQDAVGNSIGTGLSYDDSIGSISVSANTYDSYGAAATAQTNAENYADSAVSTHNLDTTNVHGIADTSALALTSDVNSSLALKQDKISGVSDTEIGYLSNVSSDIQSQIDSKANLSGATFTGTVTVETDLIVDGDLTVSGTTTTVSTQDLVVSDPLIYMGEGNTGNLVDLGFVSSFNDGIYQHSGLVRDASDNKWKLFKGVTDEPGTTINFSQGSLDSLAVGSLEATSITVGSISNTEIGYLDGVTSAIQTQIDGKISASSSDTLTNKTISGLSNTISDIANASLVNSSITINGSAVSLGGSVNIEALPSQTGNDGKYLTTNGTSASWATISADPMPQVMMFMGV